MHHDELNTQCSFSGGLRHVARLAEQGHDFNLDRPGTLKLQHFCPHLCCTLHLTKLNAHWTSMIHPSVAFQDLSINLLYRPR